MDARDKRSCLEAAADTNGAQVACNTIVINVEILSLRGECTASSNPDGDVVASAGVVVECEPTDGRITNAIDGASQRRSTISCTAVAAACVRNP
jgi:hypothetical protein